MVTEAFVELNEAKNLMGDLPAGWESLGYAYAKLNRAAEAKAVLAEAINVDGPFKEPARELLQKVNTARTATARR